MRKNKEGRSFLLRPSISFWNSETGNPSALRQRTLMFLGPLGLCNGRFVIPTSRRRFGNSLRSESSVGSYGFILPDAGIPASPNGERDDGGRRVRTIRSHRRRSSRYSARTR